MPFSVLCELSHLESTVTEQPCAGDCPTPQMRKLRPTGTHLPEPRAWGGVGGAVPRDTAVHRGEGASHSG